MVNKMKKNSFTLVELLVVVSIIAVISTGVMVSYGPLKKDAINQMTHHGMSEIKKAFIRFNEDNSRVLNNSLKEYDGTTDIGKMEFFAKYGLWPLVRRRIINGDPGTVRFGDVFDKYDSATNRGWHGPYLDAPKLFEFENDDPVMVDTTIAINTPENEIGGQKLTLDPDDGAEVPQLADKYGNYYRVVLVEEEHTNSDRKFRRLLLVCTRSPYKSVALTIKQNGLDLYGSDDGDLDDNDGKTAGADDGNTRINTKTGAITLSVDTSDDNDYVIELMNDDDDDI
jgi:prepilin-type N-terminal cleavage/methylation domain-containing protein